MNVKSVTVTFNCHINDCHQNENNYLFYLFHLPHNNFQKHIYNRYVYNHTSMISPQNGKRKDSLQLIA